ncbi:PCYCGC motif-containing (lipo)protein [Geobacter sp.]|uniref:PCYCGC motif-containing (lipo)protein n=1 Tax=Geobacter sp. TaxID=46610 RepID=UPI00263451D5|nr:PCYCGC motif-containing (lipo)protein [Geobacter sp.]
MSTYYRLTCIFMLCLLSTGLPKPVFAMDELQKKEFNRVLAMSLAELTASAANALQKKYPGERWEAYRFPDYVFANKSSETGYKIAVKRPELLAKIHCYCPCNVVGHRNLLDCFIENEKQLVYARHGSFCTTCYTQAMLALLWAELGATDHEITEGMKKKFQAEGTAE